MNLFSRLVVAGLIGLIAALALPAQARAYARARHRIELVRQWHTARLELQFLTMDYPELEPALAPLVETLSGNGIPK